MGKKVWVMSHDATNTFFNHDGRHYEFAKNLIKKGYKVKLFCANTIHNTDKYISVDSGIYKTDRLDGIEYVFVKTSLYSGNGIERIKNMLLFCKNLYRISVDFVKRKGDRPDVIIASSVHPFTCLIGIKIAGKFGIPCISEIRDLWPETLVAMNKIKKNSMVSGVLYSLERIIYKKSNAIIFTMPGGKQYIKDKKWNNIDLNKVFNINNGVDIEKFDKNAVKYPCNDKDLNNEKLFKIIYTGSIREVNNLNLLVDVANKMKDLTNIKFLIWGAGTSVEEIKQKISIMQLQNIEYKGYVEKSKVPGILKKADVNIRHNKKTDILRYGTSNNKEFEYMAAGKPILSTVGASYSLIENAGCGIELENGTVEEIKNACINLSLLSDEERKKMGENAREMSENYTFEALTNKLINVIKFVLEEE